MSEYRISSPYPGPGDYTNPRMKALMKTYSAIKQQTTTPSGYSLYCYQGSYNTTVAASAGTHNKADCLDLAPTFDTNLGKKIGFFGEIRETWQGDWIRHVHGVRIGTHDAAWLADAQEEAYIDHKSIGLGSMTDHNAWAPKYRNVVHLAGPNTVQYHTTKETIGWSIPGCHGSNSDDVANYKRVVRPAGYVFSGRAGKVRANGSDYLVTPHGTFYNMANLST